MTTTPRTITIDLDTGQWIGDTTITSEEGARVASSVLPGTTDEQMDQWYSAWLRNDGPPPVTYSAVREAIDDALTPFSLDNYTNACMDLIDGWENLEDPAEPR